MQMWKTSCSPQRDGGRHSAIEKHGHHVAVHDVPAEATAGAAVADCRVLRLRSDTRKEKSPKKNCANPRQAGITRAGVMKPGWGVGGGAGALNFMTLRALKQAVYDHGKRRALRAGGAGCK